MRSLSVTGRCLASPPPADWREQLAQLLGAKPRRIGNWAELGLYGAMLCLADAGEKSLQLDATLMLTSRRGTYAAAGIALAQMRDGLPMPLTFLQTQPSQLLALLAAQMDWSGHACFSATAQPQDLLRLASAQMGQGGVLLGCVDETDGGSSHWLRLRPDAPEKHDFAATFAAWMPAANVAQLA
jgi:hypothetical protein